MMHLPNEKLKKMFKERGIGFISIRGSYDERFNKARNLIEEFVLL